MSAWVHGSDGSAPLCCPPADAPVRRLLMDGYVYDIRDDQDQPPWREGPWASMKWRPQAWRKTLANSMDEI